MANLSFTATFNLLSANGFNLGQSKIMLSGKELNNTKIMEVVFDRIKKHCDKQNICW